MRLLNPFEFLRVKASPKAVLEQSSHEGNQLKPGKRIEILYSFVLAGYDLKSIVENYLSDYCSLNDISRRGYIHFTINHAIHTLLIGIANRLVRDKDPDLEPLASLCKQYIKSKPKSLDKSIEVFEEIVRSSFSMREVLKAHLGLRAKYIPIIPELDIDLGDPYSLDLREFDQHIGSDEEWQYGRNGLHDFWRDVLVCLSSENYEKIFRLSEDAPMIVKALIKKYLPREEDVNNAEIWEERAWNLAVKVAEVMWLKAPLFDAPVFLCRINYKGRAEKHIQRLHHDAVISICIQEEEDEDQAYFDAILNGEHPKGKSRLSYIREFLRIVELSQVQDVLVVGAYHGIKSNRIGLVKKGTEIKVEQYENYRLYCLSLSSIVSTPLVGVSLDEVVPSDYPIIENMIPKNTTISRIASTRNQESVYRVYYGIVYPPNYTLLSNSATEDMCALWLQSCHAHEDYRITKPMHKLGGAMPVVDMVGKNDYGDIVVAQITTSKDKATINKKEQKLCSVVKDERYVMFADFLSEEGSREIGRLLRQALSLVWLDLYEDDRYREELCMLCRVDYKK